MDAPMNLCIMQYTTGPSIKYVTLFLANFDPPLPGHTLSDIPGPPRMYVTHLGPPRPSTKIPCTNSISIVRGGFCPGVLSGLVFVRSLLSQYICYNRKLNITLNFMFHMYEKNLYKRDVTCSWPSVTNCHTFSDPLSLERDVLYGRSLSETHGMFISV